MSQGSDQPAPLTYPELVVGIAAPIGVDLDLIVRTLDLVFSSVRYTTELIKLTTEMDRFPITDQEDLAALQQFVGTDTFNTYMRKMSAANALRKQYRDPAVLA